MKRVLPYVFAAFTTIAFAQNKPIAAKQIEKLKIEAKNSKKQAETKIQIRNGSFSQNLKNDNLNPVTVVSNLNLWFGLSPQHSLEQVSQNTDKLGITHQNFKQFYNGIPVEGSLIMLHSKNNIATSINGQLAKFETFDTNSVLTKELAEPIALDYLKITELLKHYPVEKVIITNGNGVQLAFKVRIDSAKPFEMCHIFVDAKSGKIISKIELFAHADESGTAQTLYSGNRNITVEQHDGAYRLRESDRKISTFDATDAIFSTNEDAGFLGYTDVRNPTSNWTTAIPALDVHWGMEVTYDFYRDTFDRNSFDNLGAPINNFVNGTMQVSNTQTNAYALGEPYNVMVYGLGNGTTYGPVVGLDVEGHEFTHLVINNNGQGGLTYRGESGALNESFADIFGTCVEFYSGVNPDWTLGENVVLTAPFFLRSMSDPKSGASQQPDTYRGEFWRDTTAAYDNGGVHFNSGVPNHWFYLLSEGGSGTNDNDYAYDVAGIGLQQASQIAYRSLTTYLGPEATFQAAYEGSLLAAEDLFGNPSPQYTAVDEAWHAVGIGFYFCYGTNIMTDVSGSINDGSGAQSYNDFSDCKWLIAPEGANQITLRFTAFDTEQIYDEVLVYDGPDDTFPLLGSYSGANIPPVITTSPGTGSMFVRFLSDYSFSGDGWIAEYLSTTLGIKNLKMDENLKIYPNPARDFVTIESKSNQIMQVELFDLVGKTVIQPFNVEKGQNRIDTSLLRPGMYLLKFKIDGYYHTEKLIIQ